MKHIAFIPARSGSVGFKNKNRILFNDTANFLSKLEWIEDVYVSTDDKIIINLSKKRNYKIIKRKKILSGPAISIKSVLSDHIKNNFFPKLSVIWLFYIPIPYKNQLDFDNAKKIIENKKIKSLISFVPSKTHPYNCWKIEKSKILQFIENNKFRRQDLPKAWAHHHYVCCFKIDYFKFLNNELISEKSYPFILDNKTQKKLLEIDTPENYKKWISIKNNI